MPKKREFPIWFKMIVSILPVIGFCGVLVSVALGVAVSPFIFTPLAALTAKIVAEVLGVPPFRLTFFQHAPAMPNSVEENKR